MSFTRELVVGLAELMAAAGLGTWSTTGTYASDATGIVVGRLPLKPVKVIGLIPYPIMGGSDLVNITGVQIRFRGPDDQTVMDMQDATFEVLQMRGITQLGNHIVTDMWRQAATPVGSLGASDLPEVADSYYLVTDR